MKTASQRLRATLYLLWWKNGSKGDFEEYYQAKMELFIQKLKDKL